MEQVAPTPWWSLGGAIVLLCDARDNVLPKSEESSPHHKIHLVLGIEVSGRPLPSLLFIVGVKAFGDVSGFKILKGSCMVDIEMNSMDFIECFDG
jgi:hypothetical protein